MRRVHTLTLRCPLPQSTPEGLEGRLHRSRFIAHAAQIVGELAGQEQQVFEFFRQNPRAAETLRGPLFEEKVIDYILELAKVEEKSAAPEELGADPPAAVPEETSAGAENHDVSSQMAPPPAV